MFAFAAHKSSILYAFGTQRVQILPMTYEIKKPLLIQKRLRSRKTVIFRLFRNEDQLVGQSRAAGCFKRVKIYAAGNWDA